MDISKAAVGALAAVCVTVGAGGAYLATRSSVPVVATDVQPLAVSPDPGATVVDQSEGIVTTETASDRTTTARPEPAPVREPRASRPAPARTAPPATPVQRRVEPVDTEPPFVPQQANIAIAPALEPAAPFESAPMLPPEPPPARFEELVVDTDSVVGLEVETSISSEEARVEDAVVARVTRDVRVGDRVAIPAGAKAHGEVTLVERGGRLRDRARLGVRFTSVVLADGTRVPLQTETIYREGDPPGGESAAKIGGGAIGGAIIGGILGGARGAVIGGTAGAGAGSAAVLAGGRNPATLPSGTPVTVRVIEPVVVTVER